MNNGYILALPAPESLGDGEKEGRFGTLGQQATVYTGNGKAANATIAGLSTTYPLDKNGGENPGYQYMVLEFKVTGPVKRLTEWASWEDILRLAPRLHAPTLRDLTHRMYAYRCHPSLVDQYKTLAEFYDFIWALSKELPVAAAATNLRWQHPAIQKQATITVAERFGATVTKPDGAGENWYTDDTVSIPTKEGEPVSIRQSDLLRVAAKIITEHQRLEQP